MVNRKISKPEDNLVLVSHHIFRSQKSFLDELSQSTGKTTSAILRDLIAAQMDGYEVELSKLNEEERELETKLKQVKAQKQQILDMVVKQRLSAQGREELLEKQVTELLSSSIGTQKRPSINLRKLKNPIKFRVEGINRKLNGNGAEPVTDQEFTERFVAKAKAKGVELYEL